MCETTSSARPSRWRSVARAPGAAAEILAWKTRSPWPEPFERATASAIATADATASAPPIATRQRGDFGAALRAAVEVRAVVAQLALLERAEHVRRRVRRVRAVEVRLVQAHAPTVSQP